jgi:exonuclease SbcD
VGTVDAVPADVFARFDYVALGHLHRPQTIGKNVRYAGSPLCYSFSEVGQSKTLTVIETGEALCVRTLPLHPLREMREVRGTLSELLSLPYSEDYIRAVVTDEDVPPDARVTLQGGFPNLMRFAVENSRTAHEEEIVFGESVMLRYPLDLFAEFYEQQNGVAPDEGRLALMKSIFEGEGEKQ